MTRTVLIIGLMLLAAFLPLALGPLAVVLVGSLIFIASVTSPGSTNAPPVTFLALHSSRAPPSR